MKNKIYLRLITVMILITVMALKPNHTVFADPGLVTSPTSLTTTEGGSAVSFSVSLSELPSQDVHISLTSLNTSEGTVSPGTLVFTTTNWSTAQSVTVTPVDDFVDDGDISYSVDAVVTNSGLDYQGVTGQVSVTNNDDDTAGITVSPISGLTTTEAGGVASFTVILNSEPTSDVVLSIASSEPSEGQPDKTTLTFTVGNWNTTQTVTVHGQDDQMDDDDQAYTVFVTPQSGPAQYMALDPVQVSLTNIDDDTADLIVDPTSGLITSEGGLQATFTVRLATQPTATFVLAVTSQDVTEGSVSPTSLTFTTGNWSDPQTVTITGVDDAVVDGTVDYDVRLSGSSGAPEYTVLSPVFLSVQNQDNDSVGVTVTPTEGLVTTEAGGTDQFVVRLTSQPLHPVTINLNSSRPNEGRPQQNSIQLTAANWDTGVTVTIIGQDDQIDDDDQSYTINLSNTISTDPNYNNLVPPDVNAVNRDDDVAGVVLSEIVLETNESGTSDTFTVYLNSEPTDTVTINLSSTDTSEGLVSPTSLVFTPSNYMTPRVVTVTGVNDDVVDGDQDYRISVNPSSPDVKYAALATLFVDVTNVDDDIPGFTIAPDRTMITNEEGATDRFTVVLDARPGATVTIPLTSSDPTEGVISTPSSQELVFSPSNWSTPQEVTIRGEDDALQDGTRSYTINVGPSGSGDSNFNNLTVQIVNAVNNDNDTAGVSFSQTDGLETSEAGDTVQFFVRLNTEPQSAVTIRMTSTDAGEGIITDPPNPHDLLFTPADWNILKPVTLTGVDDFLADGDIPYQINFSVNSAGTDYNSLSVDPIQVLNLDDDFSPVAVEDKYYINAEPLEIAPPGVLWNDTDANDDPLSAVLESSPAQDPDIVFESDGSFIYQANLGFEGLDSFTYRAYDGISYSEIGVVNIEVDLTPPPIANWISPVTNNNTYTVETGTIMLRAQPLDEDDFGHLWYAWYNPTLPGGVEEQLVSLGTTDTVPYSISIDVNMLDIGYNQIFVFVFDKAGNRSLPPNNRIIIERLPYYSHQVVLPIIFK